MSKSFGESMFHLGMSYIVKINENETVSLELADDKKYGGKWLCVINLCAYFRKNRHVAIRGCYRIMQY